MTAFLLMESISHIGFWKDIKDFISSPAGIAGCFIMLILSVWQISNHKCMLTTVYLVLSLGVCIFLGDLVPFNRVWLFPALMLAYLGFNTWADKKWNSYPQKDRWEYFQNNLMLPKNM